MPERNKAKGINPTQSARGALAGHLAAALIGSAPILLPMFGAAFVAVPTLYGAVLFSTLPFAFLVAVPGFVLARRLTWPPIVAPLCVSTSGILYGVIAPPVSRMLPEAFQLPEQLLIMVAVAIFLFAGPLSLIFERNRHYSIWIVATLSLIGLGGWVLILVLHLTATSASI